MIILSDIEIPLRSVFQYIKESDNKYLDKGMSINNLLAMLKIKGMVTNK